MVDITEKLAQDAIQSWDSETNVESFDLFSSGAARTTLKAELSSGEQLILYLCTNTSEEYERRFTVEEILLEKIGQYTDIPTQKIIHSDLSKNTIKYKFYIADKLEGYNPIDRFKYLPTRAKKRILKEFGRYLAELHENLEFASSGRFKPKNSELQLPDENFSDYLQEWTNQYISKVEDGPFEEIEGTMIKFLESNLEVANTDYNCCLHWDNSPDNLIIKDNRINAVIDWEKSISGTPEWDLAIARNQMLERWFKSEKIRKELEKEFLKGYEEVRNLGKGWRKRLIYFQTIHWYMAIGDAGIELNEDVRNKFKTKIRERHNNLEEAANKEIEY
jgi:aminoglycoside phosphotransferase (APT) family kinase protein